MENLWRNAQLIKDIETHLTEPDKPISIVSSGTSGNACLLAALKKNLNRRLVIILPESSACTDWTRDMRFFLSKPGHGLLLTAQNYAQPETTGKSDGTVVTFPELSADFDPRKIKDFQTHLNASLFRLTEDPEATVIIPAKFLTTRCSSKSTFLNQRTVFKSGTVIHVNEFIHRLPQMGYTPVPRVESVGEFSFRGGILDIFIPIYSLPVRFEFFGDEIVSIREFDALSQRSVSRLHSVGIIPVKTEASGDEQDIFLNLFTQWFQPDALIVWVDSDAVLEQLQSVEGISRRMLPGSPPIFLDVIEQRSHENHLQLEFKTELVPAFQGDIAQCIERSIDWLRKGYEVRIVYRRESLRKLLEEKFSMEYLDSSPSDKADIQPGLLQFIPGMITRGFILTEQKTVFISEQDIVGRKKKQAWRRAVEVEPGMSFHDLKTGDLVVHIDHGIGRYMGLHRLDIQGRARDFLLIQYAEKQKLYLPVDKLGLIQRYIGAKQDQPPLDRMGGVSFQRRKRKVRESVLKLAAELLKIFSAREVAHGFAYAPDDNWQREFELGFEYEETPDQLKAIQDVKRDMESGRPMDRLVCGDVGYGKTEVAMRAAFKAAVNGKQVAVLAPTTILVQQHFQTFSKRFKAFPINVSMLSRFLKAGDAKRVKKELQDGAVDVVIGTHALLSDSVKFKNLGLVIIDEEQRFGVRHKEKLKKLRTEVDVLTMTATPIPRTLNLSMLGLREMSLINTPPETRRPILTHVVKFDPQIIRDAVLRELDRDGQVYVVHNRVQSINTLAEMIRQIVPEARIKVAHGQMNESALERIMLDFLEHQFDVLIATTIIESGLDIPSVNTILINRADQLGLAQLYQLRGRVGRANKQAYAYLLVPASSTISKKARERLSAIREAVALGSGFKLASRDLEIRGVGDILGPNQHGHISAVGYEMYCRLVREAVRELKGESIQESISPEIKLDMDTTIPENFIPEPAHRLEIYRRFSMASDQDRIQMILSDISDRYGKPTQQIENLKDMAELRILAIKTHALKIEETANRILITFSETAPVSPEKITRLLVQSNGKVRFVPPCMLNIFDSNLMGEFRAKHVIKILRNLL